MSSRWMEKNAWVHKVPDISPEERWKNINAHKWIDVNLAQKFGCETMTGTAEYCSECGIPYISNLSAWPCELMKTGWRPEMETLLDARNRERNRRLK